MQFREQGKKIQCIRSTYDTTTKRCHQKVVVTFDRWAPTVPPAVLELLTDNERRELVEWFEARKAARTQLHHRTLIEWAGRDLGELVEAIKASADTVTAEQASAIWRGMDEVGKALRKAGHPRPRRSHPDPASPPAGQEALPLGE